jgi:hypothetical protein
MTSFNPRGGKCNSCGKARSLKDGICAECEQSERDACKCVECNSEQDSCVCVGGPWVPGGYRL